MLKLYIFIFFIIFSSNGVFAYADQDCKTMSGEAALHACSLIINKKEKGDKLSAYKKRANIYREKSQYDKAIDDVTKAIAIKYDDHGSFDLRGWIYNLQGNFKAAIIDLTRAISLKPDYVYAYNNRAWAYRELGLYDKAIDDLNTAYSINPNFSAIQVNIDLTKKKKNESISRPISPITEIATFPPFNPSPSDSSSARLQRRVALIIGIDAYKTAGVRRLNNSARDATAIATVLREQEFEVTVKTDLDFAEFDDALKDFRAAATSTDMAVIYYAGHGFAAGSEDIVAPADIGDLCGKPPYKRSISVAALADALALAKQRIVILDACRNAPALNCPPRGDRDGQFRGFTFVASKAGVVVVNSTQPGGQAGDGAAGQGSPFAIALARKLRQYPKRQFLQIFSEVASEVEDATSSLQRPELIMKGGGGGALMACLASKGCGP